MVDGQICSFYSDDSDAYIAALEKRANEVMKQTAKYSGASSHTNAVLSVIFLTDSLMREENEKTENAAGPAESRKNRKNTASSTAEDKGQVSVWELLDAGKGPGV